MNFWASRFALAARQRHAFTLVEVLASMAIIAIVVSLLLPAIQVARESVYRSQCANKLRQIGQAYHLWLDDYNGKPAAFRGDKGWMRRLKTKLDDGDQVFFCVNALDAVTATQAFAEPAVANYPLPPYKIHVHTSGFSYPDGTTDIPLALNTRWSRLQQPGNTYERGSGHPVEATPPSFVLEIEDLGDNNWTDSLITVTPKPDGSIQLQFYHTVGVFQHDLLDQNGNPLIYNIKTGDQATYVPPPLPSPQSSTEGSYGISALADTFGPYSDGQKILAVEYRKVVANVFGSTTTDYWPRDSAARHLGSLNVLFKNGSVLSMLQYDPDPRTAANYRLYWLPEIRQ